MGRRKYPDQTKGFLNFKTGTTDYVTEFKEERKARLCKGQYERTKVARADFRSVAQRERRDKMAYSGTSFPIHFDVVFEKGEVTTIERFTLVNAVFSNRLDVPGLVGHPSASEYHSSRPADISPHFVHRVCLKTD